MKLFSKIVHFIFLFIIILGPLATKNKMWLLDMFVLFPHADNIGLYAA